jgi:hypothetical protein
VAVGRSLRSAFRSLLAASSIFGLEPGRFFGSSEYAFMLASCHVAQLHCEALYWRQRTALRKEEKEL